jgi:translation initiation factor 2 beta subunit (eIF-2beta)/eIF-5
MLGGMLEPLDRKSRLALIIFSRLIDKASGEYIESKELLETDVSNSKKAFLELQAHNHLENCINALNRVINLFDECSKHESTDYNLRLFFSKQTLDNIQSYSVSHVRNRIEHIDEDISDDDVSGGIILSVDHDNDRVCINERCISFEEIAEIISEYHSFVVEIFSNLPNRREGNYYFNDELKISYPL